MIQKTFNLTSTFKSEEQEDGSIMVRGMASTNAFDRAGDSISAEAWTKGGLVILKRIPLFYLITIITSRLDEQQKLLRQRTACIWRQKLVNMPSVQI